MKLFLLLFVIFFGNIKLSSQNKSLSDSNLIAIGFKELTTDQYVKVKETISSNLSIRTLLFCSNLSCFLVKIEEPLSFNEAAFFESITKHTQIIPLKKQFQLKTFVAECDDESKNTNSEIKNNLYK